MTELDRVPWVLLVLDRYEHSYLRILKAFQSEANVVVQFIDPWSPSHVIHRIPGWLSSKYAIPESLTRYMGECLNRPHRIRIREIEPDFIDLIFVVDPVVCRFNFREFKNAVKAYWSHDSDIDSVFNTQLYSMQVKHYDYVFCAHRKMIERFSKLGLGVSWLPYACDPEIERHLKLPLGYDICFVGNIRRGSIREAILKDLVTNLPALRFFAGRAWQHDMVRIYNSSKIVLNISRSKEINWRIFEVLACGRLLLTERSDELLEVFKPGEHLDTYSSQEELRHKIAFYLENETKREEIATQGQLEVYSKHTLRERVRRILSVALK